MTKFDVIAEAVRKGPVTGIRHEDALTWQVGNVLAKQMVLKEGEACIGHAHHYDHMTLLAQGVLQVVIEDKSEIYIAPIAIEVKAGIHHALIALEDSIAYCIHDVSELDPEDLGRAF